MSALTGLNSSQGIFCLSLEAKMFLWVPWEADVAGILRAPRHTSAHGHCTWCPQSLSPVPSRWSHCCASATASLWKGRGDVSAARMIALVFPHPHCNSQRELFPRSWNNFLFLMQRRVLNLCEGSKPEGTEVIFFKRRNPSLLEKKHVDLPSCRNGIGRPRVLKGARHFQEAWWKHRSESYL